MNVSNGFYFMLQSQKVTIFTVFELFCEKQQGERAVKFPPPPPLKLGLRNILQQCNDFFINLCLQVSQGKQCIAKYSQIVNNSEPLYSGHLAICETLNSYTQKYFYEDSIFCTSNKLFLILMQVCFNGLLNLILTLYIIQFIKIKVE